MSSLMVMVQVKGTSDVWHSNALRFIVGHDAYNYADGLRKKWTEVVSVKVEESTDEPNCKFPFLSDRYETVYNRF